MCGFGCGICRTPEAPGCPCQVVFEEANHQKIAIAIHKQTKQKERKKRKAGKTERPTKTSSYAYHNFILDR